MTEQNFRDRYVREDGNFDIELYKNDIAYGWMRGWILCAKVVVITSSIASVMILSFLIYLTF